MYAIKCVFILLLILLANLATNAIDSANGEGISDGNDDDGIELMVPSSTYMENDTIPSDKQLSTTDGYSLDNITQINNDIENNGNQTEINTETETQTDGETQTETITEIQSDYKPKSTNENKCKEGLLLPVWRPVENITNGDRFARGLVYFLVMCYLFLGVSIVC